MGKSKKTSNKDNHSDEETVKSEIVKLKQTAPILDIIEDDEETVKSIKYPFIKASSPISKGIIQALPIVIGYIPLSFAYGVMAQDIGLSFFATILMSIIVFAGSSQYIAVGMMAANQPVFSIVFTTFIVNLRHLLLSTAISPYLSKWSSLQRILFATELTDEAFALHSTRFVDHPSNPQQNIATNTTAHLSWIFGSFLGFVVGSLLTDIKIFGLDFALAAMFIAMLIMQIKDRLMVLISLLSGVFAVFLYVWGFKTWSVIIASILGATIGMLCELWKTRLSS